MSPARYFVKNRGSSWKFSSSWDDRILLHSAKYEMNAYVHIGFQFIHNRSKTSKHNDLKYKVAKKKCKHQLLGFWKQAPTQTNRLPRELVNIEFMGFWKTSFDQNYKVPKRTCKQWILDFWKTSFDPNYLINRKMRIWNWNLYNSRRWEF